MSNTEKGPLAEMSDKLTEQTDVHVEGTDLVVTKGQNVTGNEVTLRVAGGDDEAFLGFTEDEYEDFVNRVITGSNRDWVEDDQ